MLKLPFQRALLRSRERIEANPDTANHDYSIQTVQGTKFSGRLAGCVPCH